MSETKLKSLVSEDEVLKHFCTWLRDTDFSYKVLGVSIAEEETGIDYYEIISIFRKFDDLNIGDFVVGRKGHDSRLIWNHDSKSVGRVGLERNAFLYNGFDDVMPNAITALADNKNTKQNSIKHSFRLRKDFELDIELPDSFDFDDYERLSSWLKLLIY